MKYTFLMLAFLFWACDSYCQIAHEKNRFGISTPIIWNHSEAKYYSLANPRYSDGTGVSYGINATYYRHIDRNVYGLIGVGYFQQNFGIVRPFHLNSPFEPLFHTKSYRYDNIQLLGGFGYRKELHKDKAVKAEVTYNVFNSFRQKYIIKEEHDAQQINRKSMTIANALLLHAGAEKNMSSNIMIGAGILLPVSISWRTDNLFYKYDYSNDTQQIAFNKLSFGVNLACFYQF